MVEFLLDRGAPVDSPCFDGSTPLSTACAQRHLTVVVLLLPRGASASFARPDCYTVLYAAAQRDSVSSVRLSGAGPTSPRARRLCQPDCARW